MKKLIIWVAILLLVPATVLAGEAPFATAGELWQHWQSQVTDYTTDCPYPDGVSGAWSADGGMDNLMFGITRDKAGEQAKEEILSQISRKETASFVYQEYSYRELWEARLEIEGLMGQDNGIQGLGIYEMDNRIHVDMLENHPKTQDTMEQLNKTYPGLLIFEVGGAIVVTEELSTAKAPDLWWMCAAVVILAAGVLVFAMRKHIFVHGGGSRTGASATAATGEWTRAQVEARVKEADLAPDEEVEKRLFE